MPPFARTRQIDEVLAFFAQPPAQGMAADANC
jgi:hypothetical protein